VPAIENELLSRIRPEQFVSPDEYVVFELMVFNTLKAVTVNKAAFSDILNINFWKMWPMCLLDRFVHL